MKINECENSKTYKIVKIDSDINIDFYNRLLSMGIGVDTVFYSTDFDFSGLTTIEIDNKKISFRKSDASFLEVEEYYE